MSESFFVARTAPGLEHGNTLALRRQWTVVIYIDTHENANKQSEASGKQPNTSDKQSEASDKPTDVSGKPSEAPANTKAAPDLGDSYHLISDDGLYDQILPRSKAVQEDEQHLALRFTEVVPEGTYSLYYRLPSGLEFPVYMAVPFADLEDHGEETPESSFETLALPTLQAEPELVSDDPLLHYHIHDHNVPDLMEDGLFSEEESTDPLQPKESIA